MLEYYYRWGFRSDSPRPACVIHDMIPSNISAIWHSQIPPHHRVTTYLLTTSSPTSCIDSPHLTDFFLAPSNFSLRDPSSGTTHQLRSVYFRAEKYAVYWQTRRVGGKSSANQIQISIWMRSWAAPQSQVDSVELSPMCWRNVVIVNPDWAMALLVPNQPTWEFGDGSNLIRASFIWWPQIVGVLLNVY